MFTAFTDARLSLDPHFILKGGQALLRETVVFAKGSRRRGSSSRRAIAESEILAPVLPKVANYGK